MPDHPRRAEVASDVRTLPSAQRFSSTLGFETTAFRGRNGRRNKQLTSTMTTTSRYQHKCVVLHVEVKNFTLLSKDALQGLTASSEEFLGNLGGEGWELVSVVPYEGSPRAALAFFKRPVV
jgi:hypothetical protein